MSQSGTSTTPAILGLLLLICPSLALAQPLPREAIVSNDNRISAGAGGAHILHISLEARWGRWYPDGGRNPGIPMQAFAEAGKPLQIPGPLIRVATGTEVALRIRNVIPGTVLAVHGMVDRPGVQDRPFFVPYGTARSVRFRCGAEGTYAYWASTTAHDIARRLGWDSQLSGAIVVDPAKPPHDAHHDRVFVLGEWLNVFDSNGAPALRYELNTINGRDWPFTERLSYRQGTVVRWRWLNASAAVHPLHLHGFYFRVDSRGNGIGEIDYRATADRDREVTELVHPGETFSMTWRADRPGDWLFHCHIPFHQMAHLPISAMLSGKPTLSTDDFLNASLPRTEMGGLVLGVVVRPAPSWHAPVQVPGRRLTLVVEPAPDNEPTVPAFRYVLQDGATRLTSSGAVGPPIVLTQGVPVAIDVENHLSEPTTVHWHGMEMADSYFDGVDGFSGYLKRLAPMIEPGETFEARFAPPRPGTFIYHTHMHDVWQLRAGLAGPLIVLPSGARFDPATDHIVMITSPAVAEDLQKYVLINGRRDPPAVVIHAGLPQRFRFVNMTVNGPRDVVDLDANGSGPVSWRPIAIDGAALPATRQFQRAVQTLTIGKTLDFEYTPTTRGDLVLVVRALGRVFGRLAVHTI